MRIHQGGPRGNRSRTSDALQVYQLAIAKNRSLAARKRVAQPLRVAVLHRAFWMALKKRKASGIDGLARIRRCAPLQSHHLNLPSVVTADTCQEGGGEPDVQPRAEPQSPSITITLPDKGAPCVSGESSDGPWPSEHTTSPLDHTTMVW